MPRWTLICGDCWEEEFPDEYFPDGMTWDHCQQCGYPAMCANIDPARLQEAPAVAS